VRESAFDQLHGSSYGMVVIDRNEDVQMVRHYYEFMDEKFVRVAITKNRRQQQVRGFCSLEQVLVHVRGSGDEIGFSHRRRWG
jgi:hypothetical protein